MKFTKMHGCGNDYVYIDSITQQLPTSELGELAKKLSDRHFGIGGDGVIFIHASQKADFEMEMFNADGSFSEMCGNGIRCVAKYVYDNGLTNKTTLRIESAGVIRQLELFLEDGKVYAVKVDMGEPELSAEKIPVVSGEKQVIAELIEVEGKYYQITCVSMGNPHAVVFMEQISDMEIEDVGPFFEHHVRFPKRINTEFVEVLDKAHVKMRVWERGSGETLACGTGCCATVVASVLNGLTERKVMVSVLGGEIQIVWDEKTNHVFMTGPAVTVFEGEVKITI